MITATRVPPFVAAETIATVAGVSLVELDNKLRPAAWGSPRDFRWTGTRMLYAVASLRDLVETLKAAGHVEGAASLLDYLGTLATQEAGYQEGGENLGKLVPSQYLAATAETINAAAAKFKKMHASDREELAPNWMAQHEAAHE